MNIRLIALECLQRLIALKFSEIEEEGIKYLKDNLLEFDGKNLSPIRKYIPSLIINLIRAGILKKWKDLFELVLQKVNKPGASSEIRETYLEVISWAVSDTNLYNEENVKRVIFSDKFF